MPIWVLLAPISSAKPTRKVPPISVAKMVLRAPSRMDRLRSCCSDSGSSAKRDRDPEDVLSILPPSKILDFPFVGGSHKFSTKQFPCHAEESCKRWAGLLGPTWFCSMNPDGKPTVAVTHSVNSIRSHESMTNYHLDLVWWGNMASPG